MEKDSYSVPLKRDFRHQNDTEAEYYRDMVVANGDHIELLKHNVHELQGQLQAAYVRISQLNEALEIEVADHKATRSVIDKLVVIIDQLNEALEIKDTEE